MRSETRLADTLGPRPMFLAIVFLVVTAILGLLACAIFVNLAGWSRWVLGLAFGGVALYSAYHSIASFVQELRDGYLWRIR